MLERGQRGGVEKIHRDPPTRVCVCGEGGHPPPHPQVQNETCQYMGPSDHTGGGGVFVQVFVSFMQMFKDRTPNRLDICTGKV